MTQPAAPTTSSAARPIRPGVETLVALAGTAFSALLLFLTAVNAGPLWRDETNTINLARMSSLSEIWHNLPYESFPPLWPLILRGFYFLGMAGSDAGIRVIGLYVGILFLVSLWLCSRWTGGRAPALSVALLGSLPVFLFIIGGNRAYGLASCLLVLSFGLIWRLIQSPTWPRIIWAGLVCVLFAQCVYYDVVFLMAMLFGGAVVTLRRRQWRALGALTGIGAVAGGSLSMYLSVVHRGSVYVPMNQEPAFKLSMLWYKLGDALTTRSSGRAATYDGPEIWLWLALVLAAIVATLLAQRMRPPSADTSSETVEPASPVRADLTLFCLLSLLVGVGGFLAFLIRLRYLTQPWYYVEMLCLCAICLDGLLGAAWPALRPWGWLRTAFLVLALAWFGRSGWAEAHTQRSNVDLDAAAVTQKAAPADLIVVLGSWEGITFDRYYSGTARWMTVPPITSHKVHRNDLAVQMLNDPNAMAPVLRAITATLQAGNNVWLVGSPVTFRPEEAMPPGGLPPLQWVPHFLYWNAQVTAQLRDHALREQILEIPTDEPISRLEDLPLFKFSGYKTAPN